MNPSTGTKLGRKLVSTTPEGRMNSMAAPPFLLMPRGKSPLVSEADPRRLAVAERPGRREDVKCCAIGRQRTACRRASRTRSSQCGPPVRRISRRGLSAGLIRSKVPEAR